MTRSRARFAPVLAAALAASGCATTHLSGEYRPHAGGPDDKRAPDLENLGEHSKWLFFWGLLDTRDYDTTSDLKGHVKDGYIVRDVEIKDRESVGGVFLWIITAGIVNHHTVVIKGRTVAPSTTARPIEGSDQ
ncbi:MAG: hypothetical protein ACAI25_20580 [Planctomycetota bacterium]